MTVNRVCYLTALAIRHALRHRRGSLMAGFSRITSAGKSIP